MSLAAMIAKQKAAQEAKASAKQPEPQPESQPASKPNFMNKASKPAQAKPEPASESIPEVDPSSDKVADTVMSLDDIAGDESDTEVRNTAYSFEDEIPVTAPDRELPADLTTQQQQFVASVNSIYEIMHDPELFGGMIRTIMQELQENPNLMHLMADQDVHVMIRGLRSSMGLAKIKKAEKSTKTRTPKTPAQVGAMVSTLDDIFNADEW